MTDSGRILICSCDGTVPLGTEAIRCGCYSEPITATQLCGAELDRFQEASIVAVDEEADPSPGLHSPSPLATLLGGLFRMTFRDQADVIENVRGEPLYLLLAMNSEAMLRLKPQNLIAGLPIRQVEAVN